MTWVSPDNTTENQIDHICVSSKFRRSLLDVRAKRGADVPSDHHLLMGRCHLKLKNYNIGMQKTSYKYNIKMLKDDETKTRFQLAISNKYHVLASLQENEQHLGVEENQTVVNLVWKGMKHTWREMNLWIMRRPFTALIGKCCGSCYVIMASQRNTSSSYRRPMRSTAAESFTMEFFQNCLRCSLECARDACCHPFCSC